VKFLTWRRTWHHHHHQSMYRVPMRRMRNSVPCLKDMVSGVVVERFGALGRIFTHLYSCLFRSESMAQRCHERYATPARAAGRKDETMDPEDSARHIMRMYDQSTEPEAMTEAIAHSIRAHMKPLEKRLAELREMMSDVQYQLEHTKGGYYIYRFDLEAMHRMADALGIEGKVAPAPVLAFYTPEELTRLIQD
jgi:hypothetical protein